MQLTPGGWLRFAPTWSPWKARRTKSSKSALCSAAAMRRRRRLPSSSIVLRIAVGECVAAGDMASKVASTVDKAEAASRITATSASIAFDLVVAGPVVLSVRCLRSPA